MAKRIQGITIEIDGNTTKLTKALEGTNKEIRETQSALKDAEKLLKMDPGNMELLKQKQELLGKAVGQTKEKLDTLKEAMAQMDAQGVDKSSSEYQGLQREIIQTEKELKNLEKAAKSSNATMAKIADTASKVSQKAQQVADATRGLSTAAGGALVALGGMAVKAASDADELNTLAKQTGLSTASLQKMSYAADRVDVSVEDITGAVKKMKSKLDDSADSFEAIGVSIKDANGEYRNTEDIFYDVIAALGDIENETERDVVAMDLFGKSADSLAGIIDDGGQAMKELGQAAEDKGLIISQEDLDSANELDDTLDEMKANLSGAFGKAAISAMKALTPLLEKAAGWIGSISEKLANVSPETMTIITIVLAIIAAISPLAALIANIGAAVAVLTPAITALNAALAANPVVLTVMAIIAAVTALIAIGVLVYKNWDKIKEKAAEAWGKIKETFESAKEKISAVFESIKEKFVSVFTSIKTFALNVWNSIKQTFANVGTFFKEQFQKAWTNVKNVFSNWGSFFSNLWTKISDKFKLIGSSIGNAISGAVKSGLNGVLGMIEGVINKAIGLINGAIGVINKIPGVNLSKIGELQIPRLARGGIVDGPTIAQIGEQGKEAVIPLENNLEWIKKVANEMQASFAQNPIVVESHIYLEGDARQLWKVVRQQNNINTRATGRNAFA